MVDDPLRALRHVPETPPSERDALDACRRLARSHYENFTVVSRLAPRRMRTALAVLYAYCRTVDDIGDEAAGNRMALLDRYQEELGAAYGGTPHHWVMVALQAVLRDVALPREPFERLIEANRMDQRTTRYPTFDHLLEYCTCSANPVGRLVLALYGIRDPASDSLSDATCTALQLANFWQDVKRDWEMDRIYLPQDELADYGVAEEDLATDRATPAFRDLMAFQVQRARDYFSDGLPLIDRVHGHLRVDLAFFSCGGLAILDRIESSGFDTLRERPALTGWDKLGIAWTALRPRRWREWI